jgi:hypothetical protein
LCQDGIHRGPYAQGIEESGSTNVSDKCLEQLYSDVFWANGQGSLLRHCATSRRVAGSSPDCVIGIFNGHNSSERTMVFGSTQLLTEMGTRNISWEVRAAGS